MVGLIIMVVHGKKTGTGTFGNDNGNYYGKLSSNSNNAAVYQVVSFKKNTDYVVKRKSKNF